MGTLRQGHTATLLNDGRVLVAGGVIYRGIGLFDGSIASAELYTPSNHLPPATLYTMGGTQGAVLHAGTARLVSSGDGAAVGDYLEIYCTGLWDAGVIAPQITIGGRLAEVTFFGKTPGYSGLYQVNVRMPGSVPPGPRVPLRINYMGRFSNEVTIGVR